MKQILAIVKPFRAQAALEAIGDFEIDTVLVNESKGHGRRKERFTADLRDEYSRIYLPKIEITVLVDDCHAESVAMTIAEVARTGRVGDGKILIVACEMEFDF